MATNISPEDIAFLELLKKEVKETPKGEEAKDLKEWMKRYLATSGELDPKTEATREHESPTRPVRAKEYITQTKMRDPPKISPFSGSNQKGEAKYELWRYEVCGLMTDKLHSPENVSYAVRKSLKGDAGMIAMHLGPAATIPEILHKLDSIYGDVEGKEDLLAEFYRARQDDDETVTKWSCRLENIIGKAVEKGIVTRTSANDMLRSMLWTGLKTELKEISGHKYDAIRDFDELRIALRHIEKDHEERKAARKPHTAKSSVPSDRTTSEMDEFRGMIQQLTARFDRWERGGHQSRGFGRNTGPSRRERAKPIWENRQQSTPATPKWDNQPQQQPTQATPSKGKKKIVCYRCGQEGHMKIGCANPPNMYRKDLNSKKPMEEGHR